MARVKLRKKIARAKGGQKLVEPGVAAMLHQGEILLASGLEHQAEEYFRAAWQQAPHSLPPLIRLADFLRDHCRYDEAAELYEKALAIKPDVPEWWNNLGVIHMSHHDYFKAAACLRKALQLQPRQPVEWCNLGKTLLQLGEVAEAKAALKKAIACQPDFAEAYYELAELKLAKGRKAEWEKNCRQALALNPSLTSAYLSMAKGLKFRGDEPELPAMAELLARPTTNDLQRRDIHFARGKIFEDLERYDDAFVEFAEGNRLQRRTFTYDPRDDEAGFAVLKEKFPAELFHGVDPASDRGREVIFIVGMPRSGTSLIEQILASHPLVFGGGELNFLDGLIRPCYSATSLFEGERTSDALSAAYLEKLHGVPGAAAADRITSKMPHNFVHLGMIRLLLPAAKVIHCNRNPLDTCLSIYKNLFRGGGHAYAYDLEELGRYYLLYRDLLDHWHRVLPGFIHDLSYEQLVGEPKTVIRELLSFCGLDWNQKCLDFHQTQRVVKTLSVAQVRKPLYRDSLGIAERYGSHLDPLRRILGTSAGSNLYS